MSFQSYEPLRSSILSKENLRSLNEPKPIIAVRDTFISWLIILSCWALAAHYPYWFVVLAIIPIIGTQYYALHIVGHDGLHRRLFKSNKHNDLFANCFIYAPIFAITRLNRINHMVHHRETSTIEDPDRHKYSHAGKTSRTGFLLFLTGLQNLIPTLTNIFNPQKSHSSPTRSELEEPGTKTDCLESSNPDQLDKRTPPENLLIIFWQLTIFSGLTYFVAWWAYPILWLLPVYTFTFVGDLIRVFCEHSMLMEDLEADRTLRLISYTSNPFERMFFAPHNMNYHAAHHLWPSIPYYNLPIADKAIRECSMKDRFFYRKSYLDFILNYAKQYVGKDTKSGDNYAG